MSDLNHHDDEEYHFDDSENFDFGEHDAAAEEEFVGDEEVIENEDTKKWANERPLTTSSKKPLPTKKIIMIGGIAVLLIVGYLLMRRSTPPATTAIPSATMPKETAKAKPKPPAAPTATVNSNNAAVTQQSAATAQQSAATPQPSTTIPQQNAATDNTANTELDNAANGDWLSGGNTAPPNNDTQAATPASSDTAQATQTTAADESNLSMEVQTLNQENQTLTLKLQQVTAQSEATAARANSLEKVVAQLQAQVKQMAQTSPQPLKRPEASVPAEPITASRVSDTDVKGSKTPLVYYIQAIIPGRAWIADSNGRIITVTQGDRIEALNSTVKNIDPINGIVTLNNGMQIEYGMVAQ